MVTLPQGYSIDRTEVTRAQYQTWLNTNPSTQGQIADCTWNNSFTPGALCMSLSYVCHGSSCCDHPQVCVDWCDAYAYCQAAGKRLCGKIGGGSNGFADFWNASVNQWYNACSSHGLYEYPYGDTYDGLACAGSDYTGNSMTVPVGSLDGCQSTIPGYTGVYDLSGNAGEWEDSCVGAGQSGTCNVRGGSFYFYVGYLGCTLPQNGGRREPNISVGFRCCSSP